MKKQERVVDMNSNEHRHSLLIAVLFWTLNLFAYLANNNIQYILFAFLNLHGVYSDTCLSMYMSMYFYLLAWNIET